MGPRRGIITAKAGGRARPSFCCFTRAEGGVRMVRAGFVCFCFIREVLLGVGCVLLLSFLDFPDVRKVDLSPSSSPRHKLVLRLASVNVSFSHGSSA
jgi:hypothetical protein